MEENKYSVWHYNGQGVYSMWYRDRTDLSKSEAEKLKTELENKSYQGWYAGVKIFGNDEDPNIEHE